MTEQTSTATCKYPGCEATPERAAGPGGHRNTAPTPATTR